MYYGIQLLLAVILIKDIPINMKMTPMTSVLACALSVTTGYSFTTTYSSDTALNTAIINSDNTTPAVAVNGGAILTFGASGSISQVTNASGNGVQLNASHLVMTQGAVSLTQTAGGNAYGVYLGGTSTANVSGGSVTVSEVTGGLASAFDVNGSSQLNIEGGIFSVTETLNGGGSGVAARQNSIVNVSGGAFTVTADTTGNDLDFFFLVANDAELNLSGGTFISGNESVGGVTLRHSAASFNFIGQQLEVDTGSGFSNVTDGGTISDLTGTFRVTFADASVWTNTFEQVGAGTIGFTQIPEPSSAAAILGCVALLAVSCRRR